MAISDRDPHDLARFIEAHFHRVLEKYFGGTPDGATLELLGHGPAR